MKKIQKNEILRAALALIALVAFPVILVSWINYSSPAPVPVIEESQLGVRIPTVVALFTDSLATRLTNSGTSFTLVRGTDKQSRSLSGYYGFVIDEGSASEEFVLASCVGTACSIIARGVDVQDGETEVSALKFEHRRGATVKMTDYPILAYLARVINGQESASSTFMIGDGSTTTTLYKTIKADNGTANLPFVRYNEATGRWQFSDDGISTTNFTTSSSSGLSASSTASVFITDSQIGVFASSTASLNGGYLGHKLQGSGEYRLYFDTPTFLATAQNFANVQGTSTALRANFYPTSTLDVTNRSYVESAVTAGTATGTAGAAITAGRALYMSSTSSLFHTDSTFGTTTSTSRFVGVALESGVLGDEISFSPPSHINCSQSGLSAGFNYYLNGSAGQIATTPSVSTSTNRIGRALNSSCLQVTAPKLVRNGFFTTSTAGTVRVDTGFYPAYVQVISAQDGASSCDGMVTIGNDSNMSFLAYDNAIQIANTSGYDTDSALYNRATGPVTCIDATITKDATGFSVVIGTINGTSGVFWTAFSE